MRLTLRTKAALLITALILGLVGTAGWWQYQQLSGEYLVLMRKHQQTLTDTAAAELDYKLAQHLADLDRAARPVTVQTLGDPAARARFLAGSGLRSKFDAVALIALDGSLIASDPPNTAPVNIADRDYFRRARDEGRPAVSAPLMARTIDRPAVLMAAPIKAADGSVIGVLGAVLDLQRPNVLGGMGRASAGDERYFVVVTRGPTQLTVRHPDAAMLLKPAAAIGSGDAAHQDLVTQAPIRTADWDLRVVLPAHAANAPLANARQALWVQLLWLGAGCALVVWLATAWLMRPLQRLAAAMRELRRAPDRPVRMSLSANDERGDLAREFDALMIELREQRDQIAAVTDASPLGLFRCDADGRMTYVNEAYLAIHGLSREAAAADGWLALVREEIRDRVREDWLRLVKEGTPLRAIRRFNRPDGTEVLVSVRSRPVWANGKLAGQVGTVSDITERTRAERALRTLTAIFDATTDYVVQADAKGRIHYLNPAARRRCGLAPDAPVDRLTVADLNPPRTVERLRSEIVPAATATGVWVGESVVWDAEHNEVPVSHMVIAHRDKDGRVELFSGLMRDISAAKAAERALQESEARLRTVADALPLRVSYVDAEERYRFNNLAYERSFGRPREEIYGRTVRELLGDAAYRSVEPHIRDVLQGKSVTFQSEMNSGDTYVCYEAHYIPQLAADGDKVIGFHAVVTDITRQKLEELRLVELARVDTLTGIVNRAGFDLRLAEAMGRSRATGALMALMYIDIDHFKQINDRLGHLNGDALLRAFAGRLSQSLRSTDTVARLGGDEFTVIMEGLPRTEVAATVAAKIVGAMRQPFLLDEHPVNVTASIGLAFYQGGSMTAAELIRQADQMLYEAKGAGRDNVQAKLTLVAGGQA